jgi:hypothetical protein
MKKLALTICGVFILVCAYAQSATIPVSLNGIDSATSIAMITHFQNNKNRDTVPVTTSVWFSREMIHDIVILLVAERKTQTARRGTGADSLDTTMDLTDGIRIYFASDPTVNTVPLKTSVILVSTKDCGISLDSPASCKSGKRHHDYYTHLPNADLFKVGSLSGQLCNGNNNCIGDSLYTTGVNYIDDPNCSVLPHNISRKLAEQMVHGFGNHPINTTSEWFDLFFWEALDENLIYSGIRIYFSTHPKTPSQYTSLRDALVITTTKFDTETGTNVDYFDCPTSATYRAKYNSAHLGTSTSPGQDNGELCPFNCN